MVAGGWTTYVPARDEDKKVLAEALKGHVGVSYEAIADATQVVNGVNYVFVAKSVATTNPPKDGIAKIYVTASPAGSEPRLVNIESII